MDSRLRFVKKFTLNLLTFIIGIGAVLFGITWLDRLTGITGLGLTLCLTALIVYMIWSTTESQIMREKWEKKDK